MILDNKIEFWQLEEKYTELKCLRFKTKMKRSLVLYEFCLESYQYHEPLAIYKPNKLSLEEEKESSQVSLTFASSNFQGRKISYYCAVMESLKEWNQWKLFRWSGMLSERKARYIKNQEKQLTVSSQNQ